MHILDVPGKTLENGRGDIFVRLAVFGSGLETSFIYGNEEQLRERGRYNEENIDIVEGFWRKKPACRF